MYMYVYYIKSEYQELYSFMQSEHNSILSLKCSYHSACVIRKPVADSIPSTCISDYATLKIYSDQITSPTYSLTAKSTSSVITIRSDFKDIVILIVTSTGYKVCASQSLKLH